MHGIVIYLGFNSSHSSALLGYICDSMCHARIIQINTGNSPSSILSEATQVQIAYSFWVHLHSQRKLRISFETVCSLFIAQLFQSLTQYKFDKCAHYFWLHWSRTPNPNLLTTYFGLWGSFHNQLIFKLLKAFSSLPLFIINVTCCRVIFCRSPSSVWVCLDGGKIDVTLKNRQTMRDHIVNEMKSRITLKIILYIVLCIVTVAQSTC